MRTRRPAFTAEAATDSEETVVDHKVNFFNRFNRLGRVTVVAGLSVALTALAACAPPEDEEAASTGSGGQDVAEYTAAVCALLSRGS